MSNFGGVIPTLAGQEGSTSRNTIRALLGSLAFNWGVTEGEIYRTFWMRLSLTFAGFRRNQGLGHLHWLSVGVS
jgi:hypothetical protein